MPRCYTVTFTPTSETVAVDLIALVAADDIPVKVRAIRVWQTSDFGDAQAEGLTINLVRGNTTNGSGGGGGTNTAVGGSHDASASFTSRVGDTTAASAGSPVTVYSTGWTAQAPFEMIFPEDMMRGTDQGAGQLVLRLGGAPVDAITVGAQVDVWEMI
jgi:hypothetical protein